MRKLASSSRQSTKCTESRSTACGNSAPGEPAVGHARTRQLDASEKSAPARSQRTNSTSTRRAWSNRAPANRTRRETAPRQLRPGQLGTRVIRVGHLEVGEVRIRFEVDGAEANNGLRRRRRGRAPFAYVAGMARVLSTAEGTQQHHDFGPAEWALFAIPPLDLGLLVPADRGRARRTSPRRS